MFYSMGYDTKLINSLSGGDAIFGGAGIEVLSCSFQQGAVSSDLIQYHSSVDGSCTDVWVLLQKMEQT